MNSNVSSEETTDHASIVGCILAQQRNNFSHGITKEIVALWVFLLFHVSCFE